MQWRLLLRRSWFEWEKFMEEELINLLKGFRMYKDKIDEWIWKVNLLRKYYVKSAYRVIEK